MIKGDWVDTEDGCDYPLLWFCTIVYVCQMLSSKNNWIHQEIELMDPF